MKRVKFMLTAIAVFAVVGGALAFKAKKFGSTIYCSESPAQICPEVPNATTNPVGAGDKLGELYCTDQEDQPCNVSTSFYFKN